MAASSAVTLDDAAPGIPMEDRRAQVAVLTGLRGFAALMVVLIHSAGRTDYPGLGVQGYGPVSLFVLSGFLLYRPWSRWALGVGSRPSVRTFALRRVARIFPAYLVVVLAFAVVFPPSQPRGLDGWLRALTLTHIYASDGLRPGLEQTWSLGTELSWYVALPVMGVLAGLVARRVGSRRGFWVVTAALAASVPVTVGWRWWVHVENLAPKFTYPFWLPGFLVCFAMGAFVAHLLTAEQSGVIRTPLLRAVSADRWILVALALAAIAIGTSSLGGPDSYAPGTFPERQTRFICSVILAATLLVAAAFGPSTTPINRVLGSRWLTAVGRWSYGIYLWHLPAIVFLQDSFTAREGAGGYVVWVGCILAISVPLGAATYVWVERPAIAWAKGVSRPRS